MFNNFYIILKQFNRNIWQDRLDMLFIANQTLLFLHVKCMRFCKDKMIDILSCSCESRLNTLGN